MIHRHRPTLLLLLLQLVVVVAATAAAAAAVGSATVSKVLSWDRHHDVQVPGRRHPKIVNFQYNARRHIQRKTQIHNNHKHRIGMLTISPTAIYSDDSILSPSDTWGNIATLAFSASLAQILGKTTTAGKLLGAPVTAMALTFALSSIGWIPTRIISTTSSGTPSSLWKLKTLLPPGGSPTSSLIQGMSLTLATPLLLLGGTSGLRRQKRRNIADNGSAAGGALSSSSSSSSLGPLLGSFTIASLGTLLGSILAISLPYVRNTLQSSLGGGNDGLIIASALLAKNIGGGINYMAVCACLGASSESIAAGLCVDNVMALAYFPFASYLSSRYGDVVESSVIDVDDDDVVDEGNSSHTSSSSSIEALSHAFTLAAVLTSLGQFLNSKLHHIMQLMRGSDGIATNIKGSYSSSLNLSLPITTLLAVLFSMYYPPNIFLSPTSTKSTPHGDTNSSNSIAQAGETLGTSLLYLFFATAGAPGWRLKDSIRQSFPSIASFLLMLYGIHGIVLWGSRKLIMAVTYAAKDSDAENNDDKKFWRMAVAPQRLLVASSAAIGGPATAAALAKSVRWESLVAPGLLVGNIGYAVATFIGLLFFSVYR